MKLPEEELQRIVDMLNNGEYERSKSTDWDGESHFEYLLVTDNGQNVIVRACPPDFFDTPAICYTYKVADYTISVSQYAEYVGEEADLEYNYDFGEYEADDEEGYPDIEDFVYDDIDEYDGTDALNLVEWAKWTDNELYHEVLPKLKYDRYLLIDGAFKGEFEPIEAADHEVLTKEEVARILAKNVEISRE